MKTGRFPLARILPCALACALIPLHAQSSDGPPRDTAETPGFAGSYGEEADILARMSGLFSVEDPTSLYNFSVQDREVEFVLDGSWKVDVTGSIALDLSGSSRAMSVTLPVFTQTVNLTSWLFIDQTWYFESSFAEGFTRNTVAAGYVGGEDDPVKHARVGNSGIGFPDDWEFIPSGGGAAIAPGVMGRFAGDRWNGALSARYERAQARELRLSGMNEIEDQLTELASYSRGKWFVLPSAPITGAVTVYVEDERGEYRDSKPGLEGRRWRKLNAAEYKVQGLTGLVELVAETRRGVAVSYGSLNAAAVADFAEDTELWISSSGANPSRYDLDDPARFLTTIDGTPSLLVSERGRFSPFAMCSRYPVSGTDLAVVYSNTGSPVGAYAVSALNPAYAELSRAALNASLSDPLSVRDPAARFPLVPDYPAIYLPSGNGTEDIDVSIRSRSYRPISTVSLGTDAMALSIAVRRDGIETKSFTFDEDSGLLTFYDEPRLGETVVITWLDSDEGARNASVQASAGIRFKATDALSLSLGSHVAWNVSEGGYTDSTETSPGTFVIASGARYQGKTLTAKTDFALETVVTDTTGFYRVHGMDDAPLAFRASKEWLRTPLEGAEPEVSTGDVLDASDYVECEGVKDGYAPSLTAQSSPYAILQLAASLPSNPSWTAADILTGTLGGADFSSARSVTVRIRNVSARSDYDVYVQLGSRTEDYYEDRATMRTWRVDTPSQSDGWVERTFVLSDDDRAALSASGNARFILRPNAAASPIPTPSEPLRAALQVDGLSIQQSRFAIKAVPEFTGMGSAVALEQLDTQALAAAYPEPVRRFNGSYSNRVLSVSFENESPARGIILAKQLAGVPLDRYASCAFFIYADEVSALASSADPVIAFSLDRPIKGGLGTASVLRARLQASLLQEGAWNKIEVDLDRRILILNGTALSQTQSTVEILDRDLAPTRWQLSFEGWERPSAGPAQYRLLIDELYLESGETVVTARNRSSLEWERQGVILSKGETPIISNARLSVASESAAETAGEEYASSGSAVAAAQFLNVITEGRISASTATARLADSAGYTVTVPIKAVTAREYYFADFVGNAFRRDDSIAVNLPVQALFESGIRYSGGNVDRTLKTQGSGRAVSQSLGSFSASVATLFEQQGPSGFIDLENRSWQGLWTRTAVDSLSLGEADASLRRNNAALTLQWSGQGQGLQGEDIPSFALASIKADLEANADYTATASASRSSRLSSTLSMPLSVAGSTLTPSWKRTGGGAEAAERGGDYKKDVEWLFRDASSMAYLVETPPFYDLVAEGMTDRIRDGSEGRERSFSNRYGIDWSRSMGGLASDLWIPSTVTCHVTRSTETDGASLSARDGWTSALRAGFNAVNVAGLSSPRPVFTWYDQDEFSHLYGIGAAWGTGYRTWNLDTWHSLLVMFLNKGTFSVENAFHYDSPDIAGANELVRNTSSIVWKRPVKGSFLTAIVDRWTDLPLTTRREDSVSVTVSRGSELSVSFAGKHTLATGIGKNGEVSCTAGASYLRSGRLSSILELSLGVAGKLSY